MPQLGGLGIIGLIRLLGLLQLTFTDVSFPKRGPPEPSSKPLDISNYGRGYMYIQIYIYIVHIRTN